MEICNISIKDESINVFSFAYANDIRLTEIKYLLMDSASLPSDDLTFDVYLNSLFWFGWHDQGSKS